MMIIVRLLSAAGCFALMVALSSSAFGQGLPHPPPPPAVLEIPHVEFDNLDTYVEGVAQSMPVASYGTGDKTEVKTEFKVVNEGSFGSRKFKYTIKKDGVVVATSSVITLAENTSTTIPVHYTTLDTQEGWSITVSVDDVTPDDNMLFLEASATRSFVWNLMLPQ